MTPAARTSSAASKWLLAAALSVGFAFPLGAMLWYRADPLTIANESLAYRFLFAERLIHGEGSSVWVLAGFLTTAIQTTILRAINFLLPFAHDDLMDRTHWFAFLYTAGVVAAGIAVFWRATLRNRRPVADILLLGLVGLGPLYLTKTAGFYYYTLPDYYHLNVLLTLFAVWLFQFCWNEPRSPGFHVRAALGIGLFIGVLCANKVTMVTVGAPVALVFAFRPGVRPGRVLGEAALVAAGAAAGFLLVILWFYQFRVGAALGMFQAWLKEIENPGGESNFWTAQFRNYLTGYSYAYIMAFYLLALICAAVSAVRRREQRGLTLGTAALLLLAGVAWGYFVCKRPAGTTFFEGSVALIGFSAMAWSMLSRGGAGKWLVVGLTALLFVYSAATFQYRANIDTVRYSRTWAQSMWRMHRELLEFARGYPIIVVHPRNEYGYGGVAEFLLKGTADVPTWTVTEHGRPILEEYAPGMVFRSEYDGDPNDPFPARCVIFWVDRPEFPPMTRSYPRLGEEFRRPDAVHRDWTMAIQRGAVVIHGHAVRIDPPAASVPGGP